MGLCFSCCSSEELDDLPHRGVYAHRDVGDTRCRRLEANSRLRPAHQQHINNGRHAANHFPSLSRDTNTSIYEYPGVRNQQSGSHHQRRLETDRLLQPKQVQNPENQQLIDNRSQHKPDTPASQNRDIEERERVKQARQIALLAEQNRRSQEVSLLLGSTTWRQVFDAPLISDNILSGTEYENWGDTLKSNYIGSPCRLVSLTRSSPEFGRIQHLFKSSNKKFYNVTQIKQVVNPFLMAQYELMKVHYKRLYRHVTQQLLFHGTRKQNVDNICKYNFDWRRYGRACGNKFGQGVCFTPIAYYATHYGDKTFEKVMILSYVLVSNSCRGNSSMKVPLDGYDTTTNYNKQVVVKFDDNTFCPQYLIFYSGDDPAKVDPCAICL